MISGMSVDLRKKIDRRLRYRPAGYQYDPAFKYKKWDGWVRLFVDDCQFPAGLVLYWLTNNVITIIQQEITLHIVGERSFGKARRSHRKDAKT